MSLSRLGVALRRLPQQGGIVRSVMMRPHNQQQIRTATTSETGAYLGDPERAKLGFAGVTATVTLGLLVGANISKHIAAFLEENELFVPTDDDDDD